MPPALIKVEGLARRFPEPRGRGTLTVFEKIWFDVAEGEFVCIIGHSGCGKSTILNILAGLDEPSEGVVIVNGQQVQGPSLDRAVIFQGHALMPWLSALANVELAVSSRHRDWSSAEVRAHAERYLDLVHLADARFKKPSQLSGGMRQRVGIARALAIEPKVMLMDEPFSALDALTRGSLQDEVVAIRSRSRQTTFMITHDIDEALLLADRILLMTNGPSARIAEIVENTLPTDRVALRNAQASELLSAAQSSPGFPRRALARTRGRRRRTRRSAPGSSSPAGRGRDDPRPAIARRKIR